MECWHRVSLSFIVPTAVVEYWYTDRQMRKNNLYVSTLEHQKSSSYVKTISNSERDIKRQAINMWLASSDR
jgi:hypothetical protein